MDSSIISNGAWIGEVEMEQRHTEPSCSFLGIVSIGLMHATPGEMKSLRSSAERIALMAKR